MPFGKLGAGLGRLGALGGASFAWVTPGAKFDLDFANGRYFGGSLASLLSAGPRIFSGTGLLVQEGRTNFLRNSSMVGAVAGTPGTMPTNWTLTMGNGLTRTVVGTGTANGATYIDIRIFGTTTNNFGLNLFTETTTGIPVTNGQALALGSTVALVGGSTANVASIIQRVTLNTSGGSFISSLNGAGFIGSLSATPLAVSDLFTVNQATAAFVQTSYAISINNTVAVDMTLRFSALQLEFGTFPTTYIPTSGSAAARAADNIATAGALTTALAGAAVTIKASIGPALAAVISSEPSVISPSGGSPIISLNPTSTIVDTSDGTHVLPATLGGSTTLVGPTLIAVAWNGSGRSLVANNGTVATDGFFPAAAAGYFLGSNGSTGYLNGSIKRLTVL